MHSRSIKSRLHRLPPPFNRYATHAYQRACQRWRMTSAKRRALPQFIIIGAMKAGTTSLYAYLTEHQQIERALTKEVHFFDHHYARGVAWYRANFPLIEELGSDRITGEASPHYLVHPHAAERIAKVTPDVRLLALLRNPVDRAISHYYHQVSRGREKLSIMDAFDAEEQRLEVSENRLGRPLADDGILRARFAYKRRGIYADDLARYRKHFSDAQCLVLSSEAFFADPADTLAKVFAYLEVDSSHSVNILRPKMVGRYRRDDVPAAAYDYLKAYFKPHNERLFELLGYELDW
jgi:hypothetical protein